MALERKYERRRDGHIYYLVESEGIERVPSPVMFLDVYSELELYKGWDGLWLVRDATGDPTVTAGWAMYTWDEYKNKGTAGKKAGWRKVSCEDFVELTYEKLVTQIQFAKTVNEIYEVINSQGAKLTDLDAKVAHHEEVIGRVEELVHEHTNKDEVLDRFAYANAQLSYRGTPLGGNTCYYNFIKNGQLIWKDPTDPAAVEVVVDNSKVIADNFAQTANAFLGGRIAVFEVDGSVTTYEFAGVEGTSGVKHIMIDIEQICSDRKYYKKAIPTPGQPETDYISITATEAKTLFETLPRTFNVYFSEKSLTAVCVCTTFGAGGDSVTIVDNLPTASKSFDGRGYWAPTKEDSAGAYEPLRLYKSVNGVWVDKTQDKVELTADGAQFLNAMIDADPSLPHSRHILVWKEPELLINENGFHRWGSTMLVRKVGSAPTSVQDGEIVFTNYFRGTGTVRYIDACPNNAGDVYYRLFSLCRDGSKYKLMDSAQPEFPSWNTIMTLLSYERGLYVFEEGDTIVLPEYPGVGYIPCNMELVTETELLVKTLVRLPTAPTAEYAQGIVKSFTYDEETKIATFTIGA